MLFLNICVIIYGRGDIMRYLTVGTSEITREKFVPVEDTEPVNMKPRGGIWLTQYNEQYNDYNEWVDYLIDNPTVLFYKSRGHSMWKQPCSLVTLKEQSNLFYLDDDDKLNYLMKKYPMDDKKFSYQAISDLYDGIFVNLLGLLRTVKDHETTSKLLKFAVNSLILFNVDCIEHYQSGIVLINPFDYEYNAYEGTTYEIKIDDVKKRILKKDL